MRESPTADPFRPTTPDTTNTTRCELRLSNVRQDRCIHQVPEPRHPPQASHQFAETPIASLARKDIAPGYRGVPCRYAGAHLLASEASAPKAHADSLPLARARQYP